MSERPRHTRPLVSKAAASSSVHEQYASVQKQTKSRNGCLTCKARRMKCDEAKPACRQCSRRGVQCGGYPKAFRWKQFVDPEIGTRSQESNASTTVVERSDDNLVHRGSSSPGIAEYIDDAMYSILGESHIRAKRSPERQDNKFSPSDVLEASPSAEEADAGFDVAADSIDPQLIEEDMRNFLEQPARNDPGHDLWDHTNRFDIGFDVFENNSHTMVAGIASVNRELMPLYRPPSAEASQNDLITRLFQSQTCTVLSVKDDFMENPWQSLIWPLTKSYPELRHALNAMTCLQCCKLKPELHARGLSHLAQGIAGLRRSVENKTIRVDAALATTLALSLARTWQEAPRTRTDFEYMNEAKTLLKQAMINVDFNTLSTRNAKRLSFLANTWIYMDVIARLTSSTIDDEVDVDLISKCRLLEISSQQTQIDPLLGCAADLFPLIGRAADLVRSVWKNEPRRNSPDVISQAAELMRCAETWTPQIDLANAVEPEFVISDAIQTGEAFRWSLILMLRQAIPALPGFRTTEQIAQKILVYLATIPAASASTCVHMFPLLIAGCEVSDQENRVWVSERWKSMTGRLISGVVERCVELTEEAWRRKDAQQSGHKAIDLVGGADHQSRSNGPSEATDESDLLAGILELTDGQGETLFTSTSLMISSENDSPSPIPQTSMADPGANQPATTLRNRLSWLAVMHDWKWQVMLG